MNIFTDILKLFISFLYKKVCFNLKNKKNEYSYQYKRSIDHPINKPLIVKYKDNTPKVEDICKRLYNINKKLNVRFETKTFFQKKETISYLFHRNINCSLEKL